MTALLEVNDLSVGYGDVEVLRQVRLQVAASGVTALIGGNGAGKTTMLSAIAGVLPARAGRILFDGKDVTGLACHERVESGIALVPEGRQVFPDMTVEENLRVGAIAPRARHAAEAKLTEMFARFPILKERSRQMAGTLSGGEQQMLAIARGLMAGPRLLILDEPTLGLAPIMTGKIFDLVTELSGLGISILIAEQNVHRTLALAGQAYVLENGRIVLTGSGPDLMGRPEVRKAYLGL